MTSKTDEKKLPDPQLDTKEPTEEYWKQLASERQKALNDTLDENKDINELIQSRTTEISELNEENKILQGENLVLAEKAEKMNSQHTSHT